MQRSKGQAGGYAGRGPLGSEPQRVAFVSRRQSPAEGARKGDFDACGAALPRWTERASLLLVALTLLLQAWSWSNLSGYQLADSVEFMDRAFAVARGDPLDTTGAVRSFGFSTLLLPFFALARWLEAGDMRPVVHAVRLFQMALGAGLVLAVTRLGARLAGRQVGYVAGLLVAVNPIFLRYTVDPVSGVAAALLVALSLNLLIVRGSARRSVLGGLLLGMAFMMAYQVLLIAVPCVLLLFVRDRFKHRSSWAGAMFGLSLALFAQVLLDKLTYGTWGLSVSTYLIANVGGTFFSLLSFLGWQDHEWVYETYEKYLQVISHTAQMSAPFSPQPAETGTSGILQPPLFYLTHIRTALVPPTLVLGFFGLWQAWKHMNWRSGSLLLLLVINVAIMSFKGDKSFRLWLPLLPLIAPLCALGWQQLATGKTGAPPPWRPVLAGLLLLSSLILGVGALERQSSRRFGAYWDAMDYVNQQVAVQRAAELEARDEAPPQRVGAAYDWAVFCRNRAGVQVQKFSRSLDRWMEMDADQKTRATSELASLDWLIVHGTVLRLAPDLTSVINEHFEVAASFWSPETDPSIRDVLVLQQRDESRPSNAARGSARRLWTLIEGQDPHSYRARWGLERNLPRPVLLVGGGPEGQPERLLLLGYEIEPLPGSGFSWITYHWTTDTGFARDYVLVDRVSTLRSPWSWQNNHVPAHGTLPTSSWESGWILREGYLFVPGAKPFDREQFRPFGGSYRRGDLLPAALWIRGESPEPDLNDFELRPADIVSGLPLALAMSAVALDEGGLRSPGGYILTEDGLVRAGKFLLPVAERYRWPDDGGPAPDDAELARAQALQELEESQ